MSRAAGRIALALALLAPAAAGARPLVREDFPAQALALSADADGDGWVTREEIADACAKAVEGADAAFDGDWKAKLRVYGMPEDARALDLERIFAAAVGIVEGADADGDGRVTPAELKAYVERFPPELRPDMIQSALTLDADADMVVTRSEIARAREAFAAQVARTKALPERVREPILHQRRTDALVTWKVSTLRIAEGAIDLWRGLARDGRASIGDIRSATPETGTEAPPPAGSRPPAAPAPAAAP